MWTIDVRCIKALRARHEADERRMDMRIGSAMALYFNGNRKKGAAAKGWDDFFPGPKGPEKADVKGILRLFRGIAATQEKTGCA